VSTIPRQKRTALVLFGAAVAIFFLGYAIFRGVGGNPSVPSDDVAVVQDAPTGLGNISKRDFDRALLQSAAQAGVKDVPKPGSDQYDQLKQGAMNSLLDQVWIQGEAADLGIVATADDVTGLLQSTKKQSFRSQAEFEKFLKQSHFTKADVRQRIRLQFLSNKIQQQVLGDVPNVTSSEITDFYNAGKSQFEQPETRDVRVVINTDKAKVDQAQAALEADSSDASWKKVAAKYSTDPSSKSNGGLRPSITDGLLPDPVNDAVFNASKGEIGGPLKAPDGYYLFEVEKITAAKTLPLNRQTRAQIRSQLTQQRQQDSFNQFVNNFGSKWRARTFCAAGFVIDRCDNFSGGRPQNAPPACYEADPKGGIPDACPAPVQQTTPALPGTVSVVTPQGNRLPQRPVVPEVPPAQGGLGALPPGSVPTTGAPPTTGAAP
jgi:parvulin-like peptidyl-prolyl isomerase